MPAVVAAAVALGLSLATAGSNVNTWDIAENQTVPYILGIAHPTGFPAFTLLGWIFSHAFAFGTVAWRLNVFSGLWIAASAGGVALLAGALGAGPTEAGLAAVAFALGRQALFQGAHADVHAMVLACILFGLLFALRYLARGSRRDILIAALCTGLGLATHPLAIFVLPAIAIGLLTHWRRLLRDGPPALAAVVVPLALYAYFPLRSAFVAAHGLDPTAAAPLFGAGSIAWDAEHPRTLAGFIAEVTGRQFNAGPRLFTSFQPHRYLPDIRKAWTFVPSELPPFVVLLAAVGAVAVALRDLRVCSAAIVAPACIVAFTSAVFVDPIDVARYLLPVFAIVVAFAAAAATLPLPRVPPAARRLLVVTLLAAAVGIAWNGRAAPSGNSGGADGQPAIDAVRAAIPDGAIVVASWADATSLAYGAFVERALGSRVVALGWPSDFTDRYAAWTRTRRVVIFANLYGLVDLGRSRIPRTWLVPLPSPDRHHWIYEVRP